MLFRNVVMALSLASVSVVGMAKEPATATTTETTKAKTEAVATEVETTKSAESDPCVKHDEAACGTSDGCIWAEKEVLKKDKPECVLTESYMKLLNAE